MAQLSPSDRLWVRSQLLDFIEASPLTAVSDVPQLIGYMNPPALRECAEECWHDSLAFFAWQCQTVALAGDLSKYVC